MLKLEVDDEHSLMIEESISIDARRDRLSSCIVWTPIRSYHDSFAFGAPARYVQIRKDECHVSRHPIPYEREEVNENGNDMATWDGALHKSTTEYQHQSYNLLTCNCHSFVANALNRLSFQGGGWNVVNVAIFIALHGQWVNKTSILKTYLPFLIVFGLGLTFGGWTFLIYLAIFIAILIGWFLVGSYCFKKMICV